MALASLSTYLVAAAVFSMVLEGSCDPPAPHSHLAPVAIPEEEGNEENVDAGDTTPDSPPSFPTPPRRDEGLQTTVWGATASA